MFANESNFQVLWKVDIARNMTPALNSGVTPFGCISGRSDFPSPLDDGMPSQLGGNNSHYLPVMEQGNISESLKKIMDLRMIIMHMDASRALDIAAKDAFGLESCHR